MDLSFLHEKQGDLDKFNETVKSIHRETGVNESVINKIMLNRLIEGWTIADAAILVEMCIAFDMIFHPDDYEHIK